MWWNGQPHVWAMRDHSVHVHDVKRICSFGPDRIEVSADGVRMVISGTGLEIAAWNGETLQICGQVVRVEWG
jgi:hypothetical protein